MELHKYGLILRSICESDLDMVRNWRNSEHVRRYMHYQSIISQEMQQKWFHSIISSSAIYLIIQKADKQIGLINLKDINRMTSSAEAGIFVGDKEYLNTMIPVLATIAMMEFAFEFMGLKSLQAKMSIANTKVIEFNKAIGYQKMDDQTDHDFHYFESVSERFYQSTGHLRETLSKLNKSDFIIKVSKEELDALSLESARAQRLGVQLIVSN